MALLGCFVLGTISGWLIGQVMKGRSMELLAGIILGVAGGLVGSWLAGLLFKVPNVVNSINMISLVVSFIGAIVLILIVIRLVQESKSVLIH